MSLASYIARLKNENYKITTVNPLLDAFDIEFCRNIDCILENNDFVKRKQKKIIKLLKDESVGVDDKLKSAFEIYNELYNFIELSKKVKIKPIKESKQKTPDFEIFSRNGERFFLEMKTVGFVGGNINYNKTIENGLDAKIKLDEQVQQGKRVAMSETVIAPLKPIRNDKDYDPFSVKYFIETLIEKIKQNIKTEQFVHGKTLLLIDLKLIVVPSSCEEASIPIYPELRHFSLGSGVFWNIAFGVKGDKIFCPIEFEGKQNIEGELSTNGILIEEENITALCFRVYEMNNNNVLIGFARQKEIEQCEILYSICDIINDEKNSHGWRILRNILQKG